MIVPWCCLDYQSNLQLLVQHCCCWPVYLEKHRVSIVSRFLDHIRISVSILTRSRAMASVLDEHEVTRQKSETSSSDGAPLPDILDRKVRCSQSEKWSS